MYIILSLFYTITGPHIWSEQYGQFLLNPIFQPILFGNYIYNQIPGLYCSINIIMIFELNIIIQLPLKARPGGWGVHGGGQR